MKSTMSLQKGLGIIFMVISTAVCLDAQVTPEEGFLAALRADYNATSGSSYTGDLRGEEAITSLSYGESAIDEETGKPYMAINTAIYRGIAKALGAAMDDPYIIGYAYITMSHENIHHKCGHLDSVGQEEPAITCDEIVADLGSYEEACNEAKDKCSALGDPNISSTEAANCAKKLKGLCDALEQEKQALLHL